MSGTRAVIVEIRERELTLRFTEWGAKALRPLVSRALKKGGELEVSLAVPGSKRTLSQNALYWKLVDILGVVTFGEHGHEEEIHEALLELVAPRVFNPILKKDLPKRSRHMDVAEFSRLIELAFAELAEAGVAIEDNPELGDLFHTFYKFRGEQGSDPLNYGSPEEYAKRVRFCEGCFAYLGERGKVAHIRSRGAGGGDTGDNLLRLCDADHLLLQHQKGWTEFLRRYPHIVWKVEKALIAAEAPNRAASALEAKIDAKYDEGAQDATQSEFDGLLEGLEEGGGRDRLFHLN